jgi:predicted nucleic acid-binding protein
MIKKVFFDSDIILDIALKRESFSENSTLVLAAAQNGLVEGFTSSNCIANIYYLLRKHAGDGDARLFISKLLTYIVVLPIDHALVLNALKSEFSDFEDALQHETAMWNQCGCIITRNVEDYKKSKIAVYLPDEFLKLYFAV